MPAVPVPVDPAVPEPFPVPVDPEPAVPLLPVPAVPDPVVFPVPDPDPPVPEGSSPMEPLHPARNAAAAEMTAHAQTVWNLMWLPWSVVVLPAPRPVRDDPKEVMPWSPQVDHANRKKGGDDDRK